LVQQGIAEPYPSVLSAAQGGESGGYKNGAYEAAANDSIVAASPGWAFMQARDFEFEFKYLSPPV
jgi:hypothetical protein